MDARRVFYLAVILFFSCQEKGWADPGFSEAEKKWMRENPEIRLVINKGPLPICYWGNPEKDGHTPAAHPPPAARAGHPAPRPDSHIPLIPVSPGEQKDFKGLAADYFKEIEAITGLRFLPVLKADNSFGLMFRALRQKEADLVPAMMLGEPVPEGLLLTDIYIQVPLVVVMSQGQPYLDNLKKLESMRVAGVLPVQPKLNHLGLNLRLIHAHPYQGMKGVATGKYDAFIGELSTISYHLKEKPIMGIKICGEIPAPSEFAMGVSVSKKELVPILNKALAAIPREKKDAIFRKWFPIQYEKEITTHPWVWAGAALLLLCLISGILASFYFRRRFNRIHRIVAAMDPHLLSVNIDQNILITEVTQALCSATGYSHEDLLGKSWMVLNGKNKEPIQNILKRLEIGETWQGEIQIRKKDGAVIWTKAVVSPLRRKNEPDSGYKVLYQDVTQEKHFEDLAVKDELTGLYNRRYFKKVLPILQKKASQENGCLAFLLMDVDFFKKYNDTYGHPEGDRVLAGLGKVLAHTFQRKSEAAFRLGGEEFGVLTIQPHRERTGKIAEKLMDHVRALNIPHKKNPPGMVTISMGISIWEPATPFDGRSLYQEADQALYQAKQNGRDQFICHPRK